ncbi:class I SAM-dependent methyltransferase, partial [Nocardia nova]|uniref:class I SAM-dependent methyltransferase n=1 Tax=Nocardia nova TaxID=37330 RepID=UPI002B4AC391
MDDTAATTWGYGDYPAMAARLYPAAVAAIEAAAVSPGDRVVDIATGTGNAALLAAARGAEVVGVDFEPTLLRIAATRAAEHGGRIQWLRGDVGDLPLPDACADVVVSVFGVMYASDHDAAVAEIARIAGRGARIVLASWLPGSALPAMGRILAPYLPPRYLFPSSNQGLRSPGPVWLFAPSLSNDPGGVAAGPGASAHR